LTTPTHIGGERATKAVVATIADRPWGMREFGIRTPDGHRIMIAHDMGETTTNEEEEG
jgi:hypothetical protein